jgi:hypothetical protein
VKIGKFEVVDAKRRLTVHINKNDVVRGNTLEPTSCAAARACIRETKCSEARVHLSRTYIFKNGKAIRYMTPHSVRTELVSFDRGAKFEPGEYTFLPMPAKKRATGKGQGSETGRSRPKHKQKTRAPYHTVTGVRPHATHIR